jgi:cytoskeleton protein RodZ
MSAEAAGEPVRGIGARLRAARERRGLTILQAAEKLHVDARVLEALEGEDFAALGAAVYVRGHLRRYAELTGESAEQLQAQYDTTGQAARPDLTRIPHGEPRERSSPLMLPTLLLVVGVALAGGVWWVIKVPGHTPQPLPVSLAPPPGTENTTAAAGAPATTAAPAAADGTETPAVPATAASLPVGPGQSALGLRFSAPSWVEVTDANGRRLLSGLIAAGSTRALVGTAPLRVTLGNAPAVGVELNGQPVAIVGLVRRDGSAHLLIDGSGRASTAAARLAHGD